jgi:hypothetical protein
MTTIDRDFIKAVRLEINAALEAIAQKHGVTIEAGNASFARDGSSGTFKLEIVSKETAPEGESVSDIKFAAALNVYGRFDDIAPNAMFKDNRLGVVTVIGYNSRAREYPYIVKTVTGDRFKLSAAQLHKTKV